MPEHQNIEWKESWRDEYLKWIAGFANADGGTLVIGKNDKGKIVGVDKAKKLTEDLPNKIKNMLGLLPEVNFLEKADKEYIEIIVEPSKSPVSYKGQFYLRRGSTNQLLEGIALSDLMLEKSNMDWDEITVSGASIDDIDPQAIEVFKEGAISEGRIPSLTESTSTEKILRNLKLMTTDGNLTRAAMLLFGKDPRDTEFTAYLKIGKFGASSADLIIQDVVESNAFELADKALEILDAKYIISPISYERLRRIERPEYPYQAIREILFNAIIHREYRTTPITIKVYPDRLRIWNIGTLPQGLTIEDLKKDHDSYPRNHLMANAFYLGGHIESWGRGTVKVMEECEKYGLPEPLIEEVGGGIAVTLYKNKTAPEFLTTLDLNDLQLKVIEYLKKNKSISRKEYEELIGVQRKTALRDLDKLVDLEILKVEGVNKLTRYKLK
jgi:ATP-dependent DNA helicase RecG